MVQSSHKILYRKGWHILSLRWEIHRSCLRRPVRTQSPKGVGSKRGVTGSSARPGDQRSPRDGPLPSSRGWEWRFLNSQQKKSSLPMRLTPLVTLCLSSLKIATWTNYKQNSIWWACREDKILWVVTSSHRDSDKLFQDVSATQGILPTNREVPPLQLSLWAPWW